jgi:hypothetical protein
MNKEAPSKARMQFLPYGERKQVKMANMFQTLFNRP